MRIRNLWNWYPAAATTFGTRGTVWIKARYTGRSLEALLAHEAIHLAQRKAHGWRFLLRYAFVGRWRAIYEAEAYAESVRWGYDLEDCARSLSSSLYLWCCTYDEAWHRISGFLNRSER